MESNSIRSKLPPGAGITDDCELEYEGKRIAFFVPNVICKVRAISDTQAETFVRLTFLFKDGFESEPFTVRQDELDGKLNWHTLEPRCLLQPSFSRADKHLTYIIRHMMNSASTETEYHITHTGIHTIDGTTFYCAGDQIIWSPGMKEITNIVLEPQPHRMAVDLVRYSERDSFFGISELISLSIDAGRVLEAHTITGLTRRAYIEAGITPSSVLEVIAKSGSLKTSYVPLLVQVYNRDEEIKPETRLNSSPRFIEELLNKNLTISNRR